MLVIHSIGATPCAQSEGYRMPCGTQVCAAFQPQKSEEASLWNCGTVSCRWHVCVCCCLLGAHRVVVILWRASFHFPLELLTVTLTEFDPRHVDQNRHFQHLAASLHCQTSGGKDVVFSWIQDRIDQRTRRFPTTSSQHLVCRNCQACPKLGCR